jgi:DNA (cytosine-5)-methyltransferase 1
MAQQQFLGNIYGHGASFAGAVWNKDGLLPTLTTMQGGGREPMIIDSYTTRGSNVASAIRASYSKNGERNVIENIESGKGYEGVIEIKQATKEGSIKCKVGGCYDASYPDSTTRRGRVQNGGDVTPTITAEGSENINYIETEYRIRKLTPKECWRLMGYTDEDFEKAHNAGVSNSQLYKQAGNAIVKQVLMAIFSQML